jgi:hypothetical protein
MSKQENASPQKPGANLFITTEEILNATLQYLAGKPYAEVAQLIDALKQSQAHTPVANMEVVDAEVVEGPKKKTK